MFQLKKDQEFYCFIKIKKNNIQSNFINTKKNLIETHIFSKLITEMFQSFFFLPEVIYCLILLKKIKIIEKNGLFNFIRTKSNKKN